MRCRVFRPLCVLFHRWPLLEAEEKKTEQQRESGVSVLRCPIHDGGGTGWWTKLIAGRRKFI